MSTDNELYSVASHMVSFYLLRVGFMLHLNTTALNMAGSANLWCNMIECMFEMLARFLLTHDCMIMFHYTAMPLRGN